MSDNEQTKNDRAKKLVEQFHDLSDIELDDLIESLRAELMLAQAVQRVGYVRKRG